MVSLQWSEIVRFWILFCIIAPLGAFSKTGCPVAGPISEVHFRARGVSGYTLSIFLNSFDRIMRIRVCLAVFLLSKLRKFSEISIFSLFSELIHLFRGASPEMLGQNSINPPQETNLINPPQETTKMLGASPGEVAHSLRIASEVRPNGENELLLRHRLNARLVVIVL